MRDGPRRFTRDFSCPALLRCRLDPYLRFRVRGSHPLRPPFPGSFRYRRHGPPSAVLLPRARPQGTAAVWAAARSLAATGAIVVTFSSCGYLDVSVPRVRSTSLDAVTGSLPPGCPIRKSAGHRAFAPRRGLSQLVTSFVASGSHRHPPRAFVRFRLAFFALHWPFVSSRNASVNFRLSVCFSSRLSLDFSRSISLAFDTFRSFCVPNMSRTSLSWSFCSPRQT